VRCWRIGERLRFFYGLYCVPERKPRTVQSQSVCLQEDDGLLRNLRALISWVVSRILWTTRKLERGSCQPVCFRSELWKGAWENSSSPYVHGDCVKGRSPTAPQPPREDGWLIGYFGGFRGGFQQEVVLELPCTPKDTDFNTCCMHEGQGSWCSNCTRMDTCATSLNSNRSMAHICVPKLSTYPGLASDKLRWEWSLPNV
jgi:hypothetical protein